MKCIQLARSESSRHDEPSDSILVLAAALAASTSTTNFKLYMWCRQSYRPVLYIAQRARFPMPMPQRLWRPDSRACRPTPKPWATGWMPYGLTMTEVALHWARGAIANKWSMWMMNACTLYSRKEDHVACARASKRGHARCASMMRREALQHGVPRGYTRNGWKGCIVMCIAAYSRTCCV